MCEGIGPARHAELLDRHGAATRSLAAAIPPTRRRNAVRDAQALVEVGKAAGATLATRTSPEYPSALRELHAPPPVLWLRGNPAVLRAPCIAIVGTRHPTSYGERATRQLASALAAAGATVISGLALGIDGVAHRATLDVEGATVGVLGTGVDVAYPQAHAALHRRIAQVGLLVSEEPPGARPTPGSFPKRNRIIAGLAAATIVVEADNDSGALITAGHALDLGRPVGAVPGPIDSPRSRGANRLLRDGAIVIAEVADALALLGLTAASAQDLGGASPSERAVWRALERGACDVDALAATSGLPLRECLAALTSLELRGAVECAPGGVVRRR